MQGLNNLPRKIYISWVLELFSFRNAAEKSAFRGPLPLVKCVAVWGLMPGHIQVPHTDALKTHSPQNFSAALLEY